MSPRSYNLGKRAAAVAATRQAILEGAARLYTTEGFDVSMAAVAREADVAAGTVRYHFADPEALLQAVIAEVLLDHFSVPGMEVLDGAQTQRERLQRVATALARMYADSDAFYPLFRDARERFPALREGEARFNESLVQMVGAALGEDAATPGAFQTVMLLVHPQTLSAMRQVGLSVEESGERIAELVCAWLQVERR